MNRNLSKLFVIWSIVIGLGFGSLVATNGCKTKPDVVAYRTESGIQVTVETAMSAWGDYVHVYHPSVDKELAVKAAYQKYQLAAATVASIGKTYAGVNSNTNSTVIFNIAVANVSQALTDLVKLIRGYGGKI